MAGAKKERILRRVRLVIDVLNVALGAAVIGLAVYTFLDAAGRRHMFPYIFYLGALVNLITGIKHTISDKRLYGIVVWIFAAVLAAAGYFSGILVS